MRRALAQSHLGAVEEPVVIGVSELVTNAVLHARSAVEVVVQADVGLLRVEVVDDDPAPPARRSSGLDAASGRGLVLVDELSDRWGSAPRGPGKAVWFELDLG